MVIERADDFHARNSNTIWVQTVLTFEKRAAYFATK